LALYNKYSQLSMDISGSRSKSRKELITLLGYEK
jgi:hypothetical protein